MLGPSPIHSLFLASILSCFLHLSIAQSCPPFNPPLPLSGALAGRPAIINAAQGLPATIETELRTATLLDNKTTSFSIDFYSLGDDKPLFNYHFSAPELVNASEGVTEVDSDTVYRLGSISKVFTVYTFLASVGDLSWNQPITKYVPELAREARATMVANDLDVVRWEDVTVGSLAAQLSGIARGPAPNAEADMALQHLAGFPPVPHVNGTYCNGTPELQLPCDREGENMASTETFLLTLS